MTRKDTVTSFHVGRRLRVAHGCGRSTQPVGSRGRRIKLSWLIASTLTALITASSYGGAAQAAPKYSLLYLFKNVRGAIPFGGLLAGGAGNFYGVAGEGGASNDGVIFQLTQVAGSKHRPSETVLHSFNGTDGKYPQGDGSVIADRAGNLYGSTANGGADGEGVVFELSPPAGGQGAWTETVLHSFSGADGSFPLAGVITDAAGNLYGVTAYGGAHKKGLVFELTPPAPGRTTTWTETVLLSFNGIDGNQPTAALLADGAGNLYGTTMGGGADGRGAVFELSPPAEGATAWTETVLHSFKGGTDGAGPQGRLIADGAGNLYGTAGGGGGANNGGVVFELSPPAARAGGWTETLLKSFNGGSNGAGPSGGLLADAAGNLYGVTQAGGKDSNGLVFELSPPAGGETAWTETILHQFSGIKGAEPFSGLTADGAGNFFGVTPKGGPNDEGVAFELTP